MYELADDLPDAELEPGTNVLVAGPPLTGKRRIALDILARGSERGEGAIIVTTKDSADRILDAYRSRVHEFDESTVGVVDCVTRQQGVETAADREHVRYAASPVDMTGIGVELSELLEGFYGDRELRRNRILLHSLSTLLMYSDLQTVFRFLHVFTGRVQSADGLGVYVVDSTAHDERTMNTLKQLFDALIKVEDGDDSSVRLVGAADGR